MQVKTFLPFLCVSFTPFINAQPINFHELAKKCVPDVSSHTLAAIVKTESGFNPYAIGINKGKPLTRQPQNYHQAIATAKSLIAQGANIDMGIAQINSSNLRTTGMSIEQLFDPCLNLKASAFILSENYQRAKRMYQDRQKALQAALSAYNTGSYTKGFKNGYVRKVLASAKSNTEQETLKVPRLEPNHSIKITKQTKPKASSTKNIGGIQVQEANIKHTLKDQETLVKKINSSHQHWDVFAEF